MSKVAIVTGATSGFGLAIATRFCKGGYKVILAAPTSTRLEEKTKTIKAKFPNSPEPTGLAIDLSDQASIDKFISDFEALGLGKLDVLINNAGVIFTKYEAGPNKMDKSFWINYLGPFYLTSRLLPTLRSTKDSCVVNIAGRIAPMSAKPTALYFTDLPANNYEKNVYQGGSAYHQANLYNIWHSKVLNDQLKVPSVALSPGFNPSTGLFKNLPGFAVRAMKMCAWLMSTPTPDAVAEHTWNAVANMEALKGQYLDQKGNKAEIPERFTEQMMSDLWNHSLEWLEMGKELAV